MKSTTSAGGYSGLEFVFPYPPTANHTWKRGFGATFLSPEYKAFLRDVYYLTRGQRLRDAPAYAVVLQVTPPDNRRRDLDNVIKPTLDALTRSGVWPDDSLVDEIHAERLPADKTKRGSIRVLVSTLPFKRSKEEKKK